MLTIINYGSGNVNAIANIYDSYNIRYQIIESPLLLDNASKIILPGVGSFDETIKTLRSSGFIDCLNYHVLIKKIPVLGICVGMQILANKSEEGKLKGLSWIDGEVIKFDKTLISKKPKIPHLGWNSLLIQRECSLFKGIDFEKGFYFIHSYYFKCNNKSDIITKTNYEIFFDSCINNGNIYGVQFHPEKSHLNGKIFLKNFAEI